MPEPTDRVKISFPGVEGTHEVSRRQFELNHAPRGATIVEELTDPAQDPGVKATADLDAAVAAGVPYGGGTARTATGEGEGGSGDGGDTGRRRR